MTKEQRELIEEVRDAFKLWLDKNPLVRASDLFEGMVISDNKLRYILEQEDASLQARMNHNMKG